MRVTGSGTPQNGVSRAPSVRAGKRTQIAAAETPRVYGGEGSSSADDIPLAFGVVAAHHMPRHSAHPTRPAAGRTTAGRVSARGVSSLAATTAATSPAASQPDGAAGAFSYVAEFWRRVALPRAHPDAMRITSAEDRMIGNGLAAGLSFGEIARDICNLRRVRSKHYRALAAKRGGKR